MVLRKSGFVKGDSKFFSPVREKCTHIKDKISKIVRKGQRKAKTIVRINISRTTSIATVEADVGIGLQK